MCPGALITCGFVPIMDLLMNNIHLDNVLEVLQL